jgi:pimeloyl-ACP methyl ester carboxylesterase
VLLDPPVEWHDAKGARARVLWGGVQMSRLGGLLARVGIVRAALALLTGGAPGVPRIFVKVFGPAAARTVEHLVGEVRKLPPDVQPQVQERWCQPKCFRGMAQYLAALGDAAAAAAGVTTLADLPIVVVSAGDQPPHVVAAQQALVGLSTNARHLTATRSDHWIMFDEPELVVALVQEIVERRCSASERRPSVKA